MKRKDLINQYQANGYVLQSKGSGSTDPMWIDYQDAIEIDASIADIEMHAEDFIGCHEVNLFRAALDDSTACPHFASGWLDLGNGSDYQYRILF